MSGIVARMSEAKCGMRQESRISLRCIRAMLAFDRGIAFRCSGSRSRPYRARRGMQGIYSESINCFRCIVVQ